MFHETIIIHRFRYRLYGSRFFSKKFSCRGNFAFNTVLNELCRGFFHKVRQIRGYAVLLPGRCAVLGERLGLRPDEHQKVSCQ